MKKAIVITLGVIIGVTGVLAICAHLADAARLALYVPEDEDGKDVIIAAKNKRIRELEAEVDRLSSILKSFYAKEYEKY